jgi:hypothetical protein
MKWALQPVYKRAKKYQKKKIKRKLGAIELGTSGPKMSISSLLTSFTFSPKINRMFILKSA